MGQKVNPIGFRLGINRTWDSRWYAGKEYGSLLHEDIRIREYIEKALAQAGVARIIIERPAKRARITIHTARPGVVIGKKGATLAKIREACPQVFVEVASKQHALKDTRLVTLRAQASADIARCLDAIAAKVPDLQPVTDAAKTDLLEDVGVLRGGSSFRAV